MAQDPGPVPERQPVPLRSSSVLPGSVQAAGRNGKPGLVVPGKAQIYPFCFLTINSLTLATFPVKGRCDDFSLSDESSSALGWASLLLLEVGEGSEYSRHAFGLLLESCIRWVITRTSSHLMCWSTSVT